MWYYRLPGAASARLVVDTSDGVYDLSTARDAICGYEDLAVAADIAGEPIDELTRRLIADADRLVGNESLANPLTPVVPEEVWACGVTYEISEQAREAESGMPEIYLDVYDNDRPEIFFKATPSRTVGPGEAVGIRGDSTWDVPEPELALVLYDGEIVGYTIGNDMSSRDIEGTNPLYLPQAKVYDRCAAIGPAIASPSVVEDPHDLEMTLEIHRDGETVVTDATSTAEMARTCEELVDTYRKHNVVPDFAVLMTGTALVPPDDFTLADGDVVKITIEDIGTLENDVVTV
ncbi:fumarylacetoacetate hydrolase family protein [Saliphagus sp. GCM10025334]